MDLVLSVIHVLACLLIIGVILLQSGKGGGMGAGFGGASAAATQLFGGRGAGNFLTRSTVTLAVIFMGTSIGLAYLSSRPNSLLDLTESSGREASDEDTIVEEGSGELVELDAAAAATATDGAKPAAGNKDAQLQKMQMDLQKMINDQLQGQKAADGSPLKLQVATPPAAVEGDEAEEAKEAPAPAIQLEAKKPEPKPEAKPKTEKKKEPKPKAEKKEAKPAAEAKPAEEAKPAAKEKSAEKPAAKPAEEAKPAAAAKPAEEAKPAAEAPAEQPEAE